MKELLKALWSIVRAMAIGIICVWPTLVVALVMWVLISKLTGHWHLFMWKYGWELFCMHVFTVLLSFPYTYMWIVKYGTKIEEYVEGNYLD